MKSPRFFLFQRIFLPSGLAALAFILLHLPACEDEHVRRDYPMVRTLEVTNITESGATFVGEVYEEGNVEITEHGFTWALSRPEVTADERVLLGSFSGTGRYDAEISTALEEGITYQVCAFVKAGEYTVYGDTVKFMSLGSGAPEVTGFTPHAAGWGDTVAVTGRKFSYRNITNKIYVDDKLCMPFYASDTLLRFVLPLEVVRPSSSLSVNLLGNVSTAADKLILINPELYGFNPFEGHWGDTITFTGHHLAFLGNIASDGMMLNGVIMSKAVVTRPDIASFLIPGQLQTASSAVSVSYGPFTLYFPQSLTPLPPVAGSFSPSEGTWGTTVKLYGKFNPVKERNRFMFGDKQAQIISVYGDSAIVLVPDDLGEYVTTIRYQSEPFTSEFPGTFKLKRPEVTGFTPAEGYVGETVIIRGHYFRKNATTVEIGGSQAWIRSANDSVITCYVPGDVYGECEVKVSLMDYSAVAPGKFNVTNQIITGVTPLIAAYGETVTVTGLNFRPGIQLYLGQYQVTPESQTEEEIKFNVPLWLPFQPWSLIAKYSYWNSDHWAESSYTYPEQLQVRDFTVSDVTPVSGVTGNILTITGAGFGIPEVSFGSFPAEVLESTSTSITVRVPPLSSGEHTINLHV